MAFLLDHNNDNPRIYDPELNIEIIKDNQPTGSSGYYSMKLVGKDFEFRFYTQTTSRWRYYGFPRDESIPIGYETDQIRLIHPTPTDPVIKKYIMDGMEIFGSHWGRRAESVNIEIVFEKFAKGTR